MKRASYWSWRRFVCMVALALLVAEPGQARDKVPKSAKQESAPKNAEQDILKSLEVARRLEAIRKAGLPVTLEEFNAWYPEVLESENAAPLFAKAAKLYNDDSGIESTLPILGKGERPELGQPLPEETVKAIGQYLKDNAEALALLHQAARMKRCRFPIDMTGGPATQLPHLAPLREACRLMVLEALFAIENGDTEKAVRIIESSLGIGASLRNEPILISQLVRISDRAISVTSLEHVLNGLELNDEQLQRLAKFIQAEQDSEMMLRAMVGERCMGIGFFEDMTAEQQDGLPLPLLDDFGFYLDIMGRYIESARLPLPQAISTTKETSADVQNLPELAFLSELLLPPLARFFDEVGESSARLVNALSALAIERYRCKHKQLPEKLRDLVPDFIESVPIDPFTGKPFIYKKLVKGYLIYSIGANQKDDGGVLERMEDKDDIPFKVVR